MVIQLPLDLVDVIFSKFNVPQEEGGPIFTETQLASALVSDIVYQIRYSPSFSQKPKAESSLKDGHPPSSRQEKKKDPFTDPDPKLLITTIKYDSHSTSSPTHILVLNKYPIIPLHFILATYENKPQTHPLEEDDVLLAYSLVCQWERRTTEQGPSGLFAFFNSGHESGASQPHRHIQFLAIAGMRPKGDETWQPLAHHLGASLPPAPPLKDPDAALPIHDVHDPRLPVRAFGARLTVSVSSQQLHQTYMALLEAATAAAHDSTPPPNLQMDEDMPISYNMAIMKEVMIVLPRTAGEAQVKGEDGAVIEEIGVNGTVLAGTLLCKTFAGSKSLTSQGGEEKLMNVVQSIGVKQAPNTKDQVWRL